MNDRPFANPRLDNRTLCNLPFHACHRLHAWRHMWVVCAHLSIIVGLGTSANAQGGYTSPGGVQFPADATPEYLPYNGSQRSYTYQRTTYAPQAGAMNADGTPVNGLIDFQAVTDDLAGKVQTLLGQIMPLFIKIIVPIIGILLVMKIIALLQKG